MQDDRVIRIQNNCRLSETHTGSWHCGEAALCDPPVNHLGRRFSTAAVRTKGNGLGAMKLMISALMTIVLVTFMSVQVEAVDTQQIDLTKKGSVTLVLEKMEGGEVSIYKVAEISDSNGYFYDTSKGQFSGSKALTDDVLASLEPPGTAWSEMTNNVELSGKLAKEAGTALDTQKIADHSVKFTGLVPGLYLFVQSTKSGNGYSFEPFLLSLPDDKGSYDLEGAPKPGIPESTTEATVKKVWSDDGNKQKKRPETLKVTLLANGAASGREATLNEANDWCETIKDLPITGSDEKEITYSWKEGDVPTGYKLTSIKSNGTVTTLTNTYQTTTDKPGGGTNSSKYPDEKLPQTGQLWWPVPLMAAAGLILLTVGLKKKKTSDR